MFAAGQALLGPPHAHVRGLGLPHAHVKGNEHRACEFAAGRCLQGLCSRGVAGQKESDADCSKGPNRGYSGHGGAGQGSFWAWRDRLHTHSTHTTFVTRPCQHVVPGSLGQGSVMQGASTDVSTVIALAGPMPTDPGHKGKAVAMSVQVYVVISRERSGSLCHRACEGVALLLGRWSGPKIFGSRKAGNH